MPKVTKEHFEKRRSDILDAAERVFKRKGFEPTTMKDVVEESGMSRGGVYQYFSSTEEMIEAIHERSIQNLPQELEALISKHGSVWGALNESLSAYEISDNEDIDVSLGMVQYEYSVTSWRNERRRMFLRQKSSKAMKYFVYFLQKGVDSGEFKPIQPLKVIVSFMINVTDGLILQVAIDEEESNINEQIQGLRIYLKETLGVQE